MDWSAEAVEQSAKQSYHNLQVMKDAGLSPIPVFHQGERFDRQQRMLDDAESYIGLSPFSRSHRSDIIAWLDQCFAVLKSTPDVQTHRVRHHVPSDPQSVSLDEHSCRYMVAATGQRQDRSTRSGRLRDNAGHRAGDRGAVDLPGCISTGSMTWRCNSSPIICATQLASISPKPGTTQTPGCAAGRSYYKALAMWRGIDIVFGINAHTPSLRHVLHACGVNSHLLSYYDLERGRSADVALAKYLAAPETLHLLHHAYGSRLTVHGEGCGISGVTSSAASWRCSPCHGRRASRPQREVSGNLSWPVIVLHLVQSTNGPTTLVLLNYRAVPSTITRT